jgi:hypothetical protein
VTENNLVLKFNDSHSDGISYEIISPNKEFVNYTKPVGKEVIVLLSGKMKIQFTSDSSQFLHRDKPIVTEKPYQLFCPEGAQTGRALRITMED